MEVSLIGFNDMLMLVSHIIGFAGGGGSASDYSGGSSGWDSGSSDWGSSSGGYSGGSIDDPAMRLVVVVFAIALFVIIMMLVYRTVRKNKPISTTSATERANLSAIVSEMDHNSTELEQWAHGEAEKIFVEYQDDWSGFNISHMLAYTTDSYYQHACLMLDVLKLMGRQNKISELKVVKVSLLSSMDGTESLPTKISVQFKFSGLDELLDSSTGSVLYSDHAYGIYETWKFIYDGKSLKLDEIVQPTESSEHLMEDIKEFAKDNHLFYCADWGRYALPTRGAIFDNASFEHSDVNNYVVGKWGESLIQLYTYAASPNTPDSYYLVGQISVPKEYDRILIKSRSINDRLCKVPVGCEELKMEWQEFNDKYQVFTSKKDSLPAFELLNPSFMEKLYDKNLNYNIEVVDHIIYFFARVGSTSRADYVDLLEILDDAYHALKY